MSASGVFVVGVAEAQHHIDLIIGDAGGDLLAAAVGEGQEAVYGQPGGVGDHAGRCVAVAQRVCLARMPQ